MVKQDLFIKSEKEEILTIDLTNIKKPKKMNKKKKKQHLNAILYFTEKLFCKKPT